MRMLWLVAVLLIQGGPQSPPALIQYGSVSGRIFSVGGTPAADVRVRVVEVADAVAQRTATVQMSLGLTDDAGRFRLEEVPAGRYYIAVGRSETPTYFPGTIDPSTAIVVTVKGGDNFAGLDFRMLIPPPLKVSGRVNPSVSAIQPARPAAQRVRLVGPRTMNTPVQPDGSFEFPDVPPGEYDVQSMPIDNTVAPVRISVVDRDVKDVQVGIPYTRVAVTVDVEQGGLSPRFQLVLTELQGASQPGVVTLHAVTPALALQLKKGEYRVTASGLPEGYSIKAMTAGTMDLLTGPLRIESPQPLRLTVALGVSSPPPWIKLTGRVAARTGDWARVTSVDLDGPSLLASLTAVVRADGSFEFPMVPAGRFEARVSPSFGYLPKSLTVAPKSAMRLDIAPPAAADIVGEFVKIPPGEFLMGCSRGDNECLPDERPAHKVRITKPFEMGRFEVTQLQWGVLMGTNPSQYKGEDRPVEGLTYWKMVEDYLARLNELNDGYRYRVPTEAEWEYAARAGSTDAFFAAPESLAWNLATLARALGGTAVGGVTNLGDGATRPVGQMRPNAWGLYDMQGNVWEATSDWHSPNYYEVSPEADPKGPESGTLRVMKGGSAAVAPTMIRVSVRGGQEAGNRAFVFGLRLAREPLR